MVSDANDVLSLGDGTVATLNVTGNTGTVLFAGYGSTLTDQESFRFRKVARQADGFFVKFSYLFRM